ncbi:MAG: sigma 54-interacting transcriptional regulator, partial [Peptococcaceae bacterium]|nr:sigma 54-interacting transcriptional regulator [Peptococcaceae bacterium]
MELKVKGKKEPYMFNIHPIINPTSKTMDVAIIRLYHTSKVNALVNSVVGARAKFTFQDIVGESEGIKKAKYLAERFADSPENILLIGESGTGKELFVQAIHNKSRPNGPFIAINCAAMPRNLIESELFGYEPGAFTGANKNGSPGKIELANGGTLFLDEIGDMPIELQAVLLRVLEDKQVTRIGGKYSRAVDFRLVAATNKNLLELVEQKSFREDLYFRLSVIRIEIPPLRQRPEDILLLAEHFVQSYSQKMNLPTPEISDAVRQIIQEYHWPGNVRQLENAMIYAVNMAQGGIIQPECLPNEIFRATNKKSSHTQQATSNQATLRISDLLSYQESEAIVIRNALARTSGNITSACKLLKISKATMYKKMKEYGIKV